MYEIRYLESIDNIRSIINASMRGNLSEETASQISACLQQGRLFFESASQSSAIIKPIELHYGMLAFSAAIYLSRTLAKLDDIPKKHGLTPTIQDPVELSTVKINKDGIFQTANDSICDLEGLHFLGNHAAPEFIQTPFSRSLELRNSSISVSDIFSRLPSLEKIYSLTFSESPKILRLLFYNSSPYKSHAIRIDHKTPFNSLQSLREIVSNLRRDYPFLNDWCLIEAQPAYGNSVLIFSNLLKNGISEFEDGFLVQQSDLHFQAHRSRAAAFAQFDFSRNLPPLFGGLHDKSSVASQSINGKYICEYSLYYLGVFIFSSLARYHPEKWMSLISYRAERLTAIVEEFMSDCLKVIPKIVINAIHNDPVKII